MAKSKKVAKVKLIKRLISFSEDEWKALRIAAAKQDTNATALIREAVRKHLGIK